MKPRFPVATVAAILLCAFAPTAMAQPTTVLEIDFTGASALPLSPLLTVLIAIVVGGCAIYALRRMRGRARHAVWMILGIAALPIVGALLHARAVGDAQAVPFTPLPLQASPATIGVSNPGGFEATNTTSGNISLIAVKLDNAGPFTINPDTTCIAGLNLAPGASCFISVTEN